MTQFCVVEHDIGNLTHCSSDVFRVADVHTGMIKKVKKRFDKQLSFLIIHHHQVVRKDFVELTGIKDTITAGTVWRTNPSASSCFNRLLYSFLYSLVIAVRSSREQST